jgi:hypothetical protein
LKQFDKTNRFVRRQPFPVFARLRQVIVHGVHVLRILDRILELLHGVFPANYVLLTNDPCVLAPLDSMVYYANEMGCQKKWHRM